MRPPFWWLFAFLEGRYTESPWVTIAGVAIVGIGVVRDAGAAAPKGHCGAAGVVVQTSNLF